MSADAPDLEAAGPLTPITDPADPRLADYLSLTDVALRRHREAAEGLFMAEGEKVITRAVDTGHPIRSMLLTPKWAEAMAAVRRRTNAPVYLVTPEVAEAVTGYHVHRGALAAMARLPQPSPAELLGPPAAGPRRVVVLEDIVDHANVGAAFRNAAALGVDAVLLSPRCADPLYRRAVKVSMAAVLHIPWARLPSWPDGLELLHDHGFHTAALCLAEDAITLERLAAERHPRLALLLGTEGEGLTARALRAARSRVRIPMAAGVDSLNVAAASAVAFYATGTPSPR